MARRIRWQIVVASFSSLLVLALMAYLAVTRASVARPAVGGAYVEGVVGQPGALNPLLADPAADPAAADLQALIFDGLTRVGADGLPEPALAFWDVDPSGTVYTFTLRSGLTWHDGAPISADDVLFTLRTIQGPAFAGDPGVAAVWRAALVERIDERSVRARLEAPFAPLLRTTTFPVLPAHLLRDVPPEQWSSAAFSRAPIGSGPYRLVELTPERALLVANPAHFDGRPFLDSLELRFYDSRPTALAALVRGEIMGMAYLSTADLGQLNLPRGVERHPAPLDSLTQLTFNLRAAPLDDQGLRRALAIGLDKELLIASALDGQAARVDTPILPGWWAAAPDVVWYPHDREQAADLLRSLGYEPGADGALARDGEPLSLSLLTDASPEREAVAREIARQWGELGIRVVVEPLESAELQRRLEAHDFTLALHGWQRLGADPDVFELWHSSRAEAGRNYAGLADESLDELLVAARQTADIEARAAAYAEFQRRWVELAPSITLYQPLLVHAAVAEVGGLADDPAGEAGTQLVIGREGRFHDVARWYVRSSREIRGDLRS